MIKRALEDVENGNHQWSEYNPLFKKYLPIIIDVCGEGGVETNLQYYIKREGGFENEITETLLGAPHSRAVAKFELLSGKVGYGKTTTIRYIINEIVNEKYPGVFSLIVHSSKLSKINPIEELENRFTKLLQDKLINDFFKNKPYNFFKAYLSTIGAPTSTETIMATMNNGIHWSDILNFIDDYQKNRMLRNVVKTILIAFDNIDENHAKTLDKAKSFFEFLKDHCNKSILSKVVTLLIPIREYNQKYFQTDVLQPIRMRGIDFNEVFRSKILQMEEDVTPYIKNYNERISNRYIGKESKASELMLMLSKDSPHFRDTIIGLGEVILNKKDSERINILDNLSAGNLKILVKNIFNILHSKKLPLTELFQYRYGSLRSKKKKLSQRSMTTEQMVECLLAVHYPWYDVESSTILNIFNALDSTAENDYQNVLVIPRIIFMLENHGKLQKGQIEHLMEIMGYHNKYIKAGLKKCMDYGLFKTINGVDIDHLNENSKIELSTAGKLYINFFPFKFSYLQYMCEDTPMEAKYRVDILKKYSSLDSYGNVGLRQRSVNKFIKFLEENEKNEMEHIESHFGMDKTEQLTNTGIYRNGKYNKLTAIMKSAMKDEIDKIVKAVKQ